jgi:hypothetical protein
MAATATPKAPTQSTKPGATGEPAAKPKKEKVVKVRYPGLACDDKGKATTPLKDYPTDHDPKVHFSLRPKDFVNEAPLLRRNAGILQARATKMLGQADIVEKLGSVEQRQKAKKLMHVREQLAKIEADLRAQGIDPNALGS